jgi:hypothetical protein
VTRIDDPFGLLDFARDYLDANGITHYREIRTEDLAQAFRGFFGVPAFARLSDLNQLCQRLGISLGRLAPVSEELLAVNTWPDSGAPSIYVRPDLRTMRAEHSIGHELREVLENAFKRIKPEYEGLDTSDNAQMNAESDQFASCLLMPAVESKELLAQLGYDPMSFSRETTRSLPSVILRTQQLFPKGSNEGPVAGLWLFEAPWKSVEDSRATARDLVVRYHARLRGFSQAKGGNQEARLARFAFPGSRAKATEVSWVSESVRLGQPLMEQARGFDLFGERDFDVMAEPIFVQGSPWRVLFSAVRRDSTVLTRAWTERVVRTYPESFADDGVS